MPYQKTVWKSKDLITSSKMNNIENGIENLEEKILNPNNSTIFVAEYGVTTTAEVYAAKTAGKQIFANKNGIYYPLVGGGNTSTGASAYALVDGSGYVINILRLANPSTWTSSSMTLAESDSPVLTNARASETPAASSNDTHFATTAFVQTAVSNATILTAPNGTNYKLKVANDGTLSTEIIT